VDIPVLVGEAEDDGVGIEGQRSYCFRCEARAWHHYCATESIGQTGDLNCVLGCGLEIAHWRE
jgi:hypothetical protein